MYKFDGTDKFVEDEELNERLNEAAKFGCVDSVPIRKKYNKFSKIAMLCIFIPALIIVVLSIKPLDNLMPCFILGGISAISFVVYAIVGRKLHAEARKVDLEFTHMIKDIEAEQLTAEAEKIKDWIVTRAQLATKRRKN